MDKRILDCLQGKQGSYILPFLWLHGESQERVRQEMLAIKNSGISQFCAESRPYEEFCREKWWDDFGFILKTAKELGMRVWLLDDKKFPTGYANGYLERPENAHLRKRLIREIQIDAQGPMKGAKLYAGGRVRPEEKVLQVIAYRYRDKDEGLDYKTAVDLTEALNDGMVYWDVPKGNWRVCITIESKPYEYENDRLFYYIDMLNKDSCRAMIDAIYEPHYQHFKEYFGNTFAGFFSDEPGFLNVADTYYNQLGKIGSPYPWRNDLMDLIAEGAGIDKAEARLYTPALWEDLGEITPIIRTHYMDTVTKLYRENFSYLLGDWCRDHGVMYIGHVIEDMGAHMRLGYGSGHYFRALDGQDMAGIDIVLMQDIPGVCDNAHRGPLADGGKADPAFFRYTLPKLAASHSHIQPLKENRAMCELFGAFGWAEGLPFMKGLADIMLSNGVNYFVPHAFSPTEEDEDCPPHFYNGGKNIQYPEFKLLMDYMARCSHILTEGTHKADVALFYNAEAEWAEGDGYRFFDTCKHLTQNLIDFDIVPYDAIEGAQVKGNKFVINKESYGALVVSSCKRLPEKLIRCFEALAKNGVPVIFLDNLPSNLKGEKIENSAFEIIESQGLASFLRANSLCHVLGKGEGLKHLRFYHLEKENKDIYLFSNEGINETVDAYLTLPQTGEYLVYEPWENKLYKGVTEEKQLHLCLNNGNVLFVIFGDSIPNDIKEFTYESKREALPLSFEISVKEEGSEAWQIIAQGSPCFDISAPDKMPHFSGSVRYKATFTNKEGFNVIDLGQVGEVAQVWLNGQDLGTRINAPYKFSMSGALKDGENHLEIIVKSNLAHKRRDYMSGFMQIPPTGIMGEICLCKY